MLTEIQVNQQIPGNHFTSGSGTSRIYQVAFSPSPNRKVQTIIHISPSPNSKFSSSQRIVPTLSPARQIIFDQPKVFFSSQAKTDIRADHDSHQEEKR